MALRYMAILAESFDPGGCSLCPISPWAAATMRAPTESPPTVAAVAVGAIAPWRAEANEVELVVEEGELGADGGANAVLISAIRARTESRLTKE